MILGRTVREPVDELVEVVRPIRAAALVHRLVLGVRDQRLQLRHRKPALHRLQIERGHNVVALGPAIGCPLHALEVGLDAPSAPRPRPNMVDIEEAETRVARRLVGHDVAVRVLAEVLADLFGKLRVVVPRQRLPTEEAVLRVGGRLAALGLGFVPGRLDDCLSALRLDRDVGVRFLPPPELQRPFALCKGLVVPGHATAGDGMVERRSCSDGHNREFRGERVSRIRVPSSGLSRRLVLVLVLVRVLLLVVFLLGSGGCGLFLHRRLSCRRLGYRGRSDDKARVSQLLDLLISEPSNSGLHLFHGGVVAFGAFGNHTGRHGGFQHRRQR
mmetsp:Transcript_61568/g.169210  ORF Transcript_61568/g.169210 Transcript_61568/m.169210 type:complete len:329 (+) Transcript_61568:737-1723(+)